MILGAVDKASSVISNAVGKSTKELEKLGRSNRIKENLNSIGDRAVVMGGVVTAAFMPMIAAAEESEIANNRLEAVFRSMGDTTGQAARQASEYASALSMQIGVEDEAILAAQAKLATFAKVSDQTARMSGVFDRATQAAFDLASAGFGDASSNATQLGKALQDPIKGITALSRSGVTFTQQEKDKIKALVAANRTLDAQNIILKAVETQVGGNAKATASNTRKMIVSWGEVSETIGKALLPALNKISAWLTSVVPRVQAFIENNQGLVQAIAAGGVALLAFGVAFKIAAGAMAIFNAVAAANPVVLIIAAIAAAAALIIFYWDEIKAFFIALWERIKSVFLRTFEWMKALFLKYHPLGILIKNWDNIVAWFRQIWERVKTAFVAMWEWAKNLFLNYHPYGLIIKHWDKIVGWFRQIWERVQNVFMSWVSFVLSLGARFYQAGANIARQIWEGIKSMASKPIEAIKSIVGKMRDFLPFSPAKTGPLRDINRVRIVETIADGMKPAALTGKMSKIMSAARASITQGLSVTGGGASSISPSRGGGAFNYSPSITINGATPESERNFREILQQHKNDIVRIIDEKNRRGGARAFA